MKLSDGIHQLSREQYDAITDRTNWSLLKFMAKSPAHYRQALLERGTGKGDTAARVRGRVTHLAVFEAERFASEVAVWTGERRSGKAWDKFCAENDGKELLKEDERTQCLAIQRAVRNHPVASRYLMRGGRPEITATWTYESPAIGAVEGFKVACKGRLDFVRSKEPVIVDLKTTRDASPEGFGKEAARYRYHTQAAFYADGYRAATGQDLPYVIIAVEPEEPFAVSVFRVPPQLMQMGRDEYRTLLQRLEMCRKSFEWPPYLEEEADLEFPRWAMPWDADEDATGLGLNFGDAA